MPTLDSYLFFDGTCREAMTFYQQVLGGTMQNMLTYAESPDPASCPPGAGDRIMHASLVLDGRMLMASDSPPGMHKGREGFALALNYPTVEEARKTFDALAQGGAVMMPMGKTFWTEAFGMLTDKYGTAWMVSGGKQAG
jgi:PhnB protein